MIRRTIAAITLALCLPAVAGELPEPEARALSHLLSIQRPDGSWVDGPLRANAAALLALCVAPDDQARDAAARAAQWLAGQATDGAFAVPGSDAAGIDQSLSLWALSEACQRGLLTNRTAILDGYRFLAERQQESGAWTTTMGSWRGIDALATSLAMVALKSASRQGATSPVIRDGAEALAKLRDSSGDIGIQARGFGGHAGCGAALLALQQTGPWYSDLSLGALHAMDVPTVGWPGSVEHPFLHVFLTQSALALNPSPSFERWQTQVLPSLLQSQRPDGTWPTPVREKKAGETYVTALALLTLLAPDHMPVTLAPQRPAKAPPAWIARRGSASLVIRIDLPLRPEDAQAIRTPVGSAPSRPQDVFVACDNAEVRRELLALTNLPPALTETGAAFDALLATNGLQDDIVRQWLVRHITSPSPDALLDASFVSAELVAWFSRETGSLKKRRTEFAPRLPVYLDAARRAWIDGDVTALMSTLETLEGPMRASCTSLRRTLSEGAVSSLDSWSEKGRSGIAVLDVALVLGEGGLLDVLAARGWTVEAYSDDV